ncbi:MAG: hypothetical protein ABIP38_12440, partial [Steroidobacteraceae bacterium]
MRRPGLSRRSVLASVGAASVSPVLLGRAGADTAVAAPGDAHFEVRTELAFEGEIRTGPQLRSSGAPGQ